jgi:hypothetical protein
VVEAVARVEIGRSCGVSGGSEWLVGLNFTPNQTNRTITASSTGSKMTRSRLLHLGSVRIGCFCQRDFSNGDFSSLTSAGNDGAHGALNTFDFHYPVLENVPELLNVRR